MYSAGLSISCLKHHFDTLHANLTSSAPSRIKHTSICTLCHQVCVSAPWGGESVTTGSNAFCTSSQSLRSFLWSSGLCSLCCPPVYLSSGLFLLWSDYAACIANWETFYGFSVSADWACLHASSVGKHGLQWWARHTEYHQPQVNIFQQPVVGSGGWRSVCASSGRAALLVIQVGMPSAASCKCRVKCIRWKARLYLKIWALAS